MAYCGEHGLVRALTLALYWTVEVVLRYRICHSVYDMDGLGSHILHWAGFAVIHLRNTPMYCP